jgi:hypothetical protein
MAAKKKQTPRRDKRGPLHPETLSLAILTALIDPEGVRQSKATRTRPNAFFTALHLLWSIDDWLKGPSETYYSPEELEEIKSLKLWLFERDWHFLKGERFTLKDAVNQVWCRHKTERNLRKFLERNAYPFHFFKLFEVSEEFITTEAYKMALEKDQKRLRKLDLARKNRRTEEPKREITTGISIPKNGIKLRTSAKKGRTSGKSKATSSIS